MVSNGVLVAQMEGLDISTNGTYDTTTVSSVIVNASSGGSGGSLAEIVASDNGVYTTPSGYDGISKVTVNVPNIVGDVDLDDVIYYTTTVTSTNTTITTGTLSNNTIRVA